MKEERLKNIHFIKPGVLKERTHISPINPDAISTNRVKVKGLTDPETIAARIFKLSSKPNATVEEWKEVTRLSNILNATYSNRHKDDLNKMNNMMFESSFASTNLPVKHESPADQLLEPNKHAPEPTDYNAHLLNEDPKETELQALRAALKDLMSMKDLGIFASEKEVKDIFRSVNKSNEAKRAVKEWEQAHKPTTTETVRNLRPSIFSDDSKEYIRKGVAAAIVAFAIGYGSTFLSEQHNSGIKEDIRPNTKTELVDTQEKKSDLKPYTVEKPYQKVIPKSDIFLDRGQSLTAQPGDIVLGDVIVDGKILFDNQPETGLITIIDKPSKVEAPYGANLIRVEKPEDRFNTVLQQVEQMKNNGCIKGCDVVKINDLNNKPALDR